LEKASRRRFTAKYKLRVLEQADGCTEPGQIGALLRREGLYSSHLTTWRRQREAGALAGLASRKRGCKVNPQTSQTRRMAELERDNERLRHRLVQAETIIDVQKKVSSLLGIPLSRPETD
jgi:transposase